MFDDGWGSNQNIVDDLAEISNWGSTDQPIWEDYTNGWDSGDDGSGGYGW